MLGWTNYDTWSADRGLADDADSYRFWRARIAQILQEAGDGRRGSYSLSVYDVAIRDLANELQEHHKDLAAQALCEVNWREIAARYIADDVDNVAPEENQD